MVPRSDDEHDECTSIVRHGGLRFDYLNTVTETVASNIQVWIPGIKTLHQSYANTVSKVLERFQRKKLIHILSTYTVYTVRSNFLGCMILSKIIILKKLPRE